MHVPSITHTKLAWVCWQSKIMIYVCTKPHCIKLSWFCCQKQNHDIFMHQASVHKPVNNCCRSKPQCIQLSHLCTQPQCIKLSWVWCHNKTMTDLWNEAWCINVSRFRYGLKIMILVWAQARCIQILRCCGWQLYAQRMGAYIYHEFALEANSWYIYVHQAALYNTIGMLLPSANSWSIYAQSLIA